jgi:hypothetical protein
VTIEERELDDLLEGIDVERARKRRAPRRPRVHCAQKSSSGRAALCAQGARSNCDRSAPMMIGPHH